MTSTPSLSVSERHALADLLAEVGPGAPTCCEGWTTAHLAAHLVIRDRRPDSAPGAVLGGPFGAWTARLLERTRLERDYADLVRDVRSGPPRWSPTAWPAVDRLVNTAEMAVHHEDVRRAQPGWEPRVLPRSAQDQLWGAVPFLARAGRADHPGGLLFRRTDVEGVEKLVKKGDTVTSVAGEPMELLFWAGGRDAARVTVTPPT
ncbi:TIGR03085 family metal-binding protein [Goekera deserti]|uniref:TIGR03085 family metal-binding protein n=1 Tax=Goekera deserti TaxID=2497753 RepID=UPI001F35011A|nr:TIGR03085 family metal-binding protein [Goekera deserti]